jgi:hypothetical protein
MVLYLEFQNRSDFADMLRGYELHRTKIEGVPVTINLSDIVLKFHTITLFVIVFIWNLFVHR